mgnify:CR=1 FL=1
MSVNDILNSSEYLFDMALEEANGDVKLARKLLHESEYYYQKAEEIKEELDS